MIGIRIADGHTNSAVRGDFNQSVLVLHEVVRIDGHGCQCTVSELTRRPLRRAKPGVFTENPVAATLSVLYKGQRIDYE